MLKPKKLFKFLFWIFIIVLILNTKNMLRRIYPVKYGDTILDAAAMYNLDPLLVCAVIKTESNFNPNAQSGKNAKGLMQITDPTAEWIREKANNFSSLKLTDAPEENIFMGCFYIDYLLNYYNGNEKNALAAYNAGFNTVNRWLSDRSLSSDGVNLDKIPYRETELYVTKVLNNKRIYTLLYARGIEK